MQIGKSKFLNLNFLVLIFLGSIVVKLVMIDNVFKILSLALGEIILALIIMYLLNPLVILLQEKLKISRSSSVAVSYLILILLIIALFIIITPAVMDSFESFINALPRYNAAIVSLINNLGLEKFNISVETVSSLLTEFNNLLYNLSQNLLAFVEQAIISARVLLGWIVSWVMSLLLAWYGLKEYPNMGEKIEDYIQLLFKKETAKSIIHIIDLTDEAFRNFIVGKLVTCFLLGLITYFGMLLFNIVSAYTIPYLPLIALIVGITNMIPYFGPLIGAVPCVLMSLFNGFVPGMAVLIIIVIMQQVDNLLVGPRVLGSYVGISPFWTIAFISIGGALKGALGMIIAVPIGTVLLVLWREYIENRREAVLK